MYILWLNKPFHFSFSEHSVTREENPLRSVHISVGTNTTKLFYDFGNYRYSIRLTNFIFSVSMTNTRHKSASRFFFTNIRIKNLLFYSKSVKSWSWIDSITWGDLGSSGKKINTEVLINCPYQ